MEWAFQVPQMKQAFVMPAAAEEVPQHWQAENLAVPWWGQAAKRMPWVGSQQDG